jgi:hypothetical protein
MDRQGSLYAASSSAGESRDRQPCATMAEAEYTSGSSPFLGQVRWRAQANDGNPNLDANEIADE